MISGYVHGHARGMDFHATHSTLLHTLVRFVLVYGLTYLFSNWGANTTTFIVPSEAFPTRIRATAHGLSAAAGKIGATVGNTALVLIYNMKCEGKNCASGSSPGATEGIVNVMWVCAGICGAGLLLTIAFTRETMNKTLEEVDAGSAVEAAYGTAMAESRDALKDAGEPVKGRSKRLTYS